jgi:putative membrane-bound dehydrogenase-like protein
VNRAPIFRCPPQIIATILFCAAAVSAAEPPVDAKDLPSIPPTEPSAALATFQIKKGFRLELVASEPDVIDPVAMSFDENGRLFVVEMRDYPEQRDKRLGRIRMLEDTHGNGRFDKSTIFADDLPWPTAVICAAGGIFVGATPDIIYLKDTNGDGKADVRKVVYTGFGGGVDRLNVQQLLNSFTWGQDNRLHGASAGSAGTITRPDAREMPPLNLGGKDFSFDPHTLEIRAENGGGQYGLSFDDYGRKYVCSNSSHIMTYMYERRYGGRNPLYAMPASLVGIAVDGPAAEVYRISPDEAWRVIRTKWRVAGTVPGLIEGGGRPSGYFTGATGITIYRGNAFPKEYLGDAFIADVGSNLVHHKRIRPDGVGVLAERPADEQKVEFLASRDNWFRPVQFANAPDGTLYIADMYREVIEHPWSLPESIKKHLNLNTRDRGRIYRIVPDGFKQPPPPRLGKATTADLVALLEHPNGWHRDTAARLIYERQDKAAVAAIEKLLKESKSSVGRLHALYALDGLASLREEHVLSALADNDSPLREHAVSLSERFLDRGQPSPALWKKLRALANDPAITVRYRLAFTLGQIARPDKFAILADIARRDFENQWMQSAILSSLSVGAGEMFKDISADQKLRENPAGQDFLKQLAALIGARRNEAEVGRVIDFLTQQTDPSIVFSLANGLGDGMQQYGGSLLKASPKMRDIIAQAAKSAGDEKTAEPTRILAIQLLSRDARPEVATSLVTLLNPRNSQEIELAAIRALDHVVSPEIAGALLRAWPGFTPRLRSEAMSAMLKRPERADVLLKAIDAARFRATELTSTQINFLRNHDNGHIRDLAGKVLGKVPGNSRQQIVDSFLPSLNLAGQAERGRTIYMERCSACHRLGGQGFALGPDLVTVKTSGKEKILTNILDPNREVAPNYLAYLIETKDGESVLGVIQSETATAVTLRQAYGNDTVLLRASIRKMRSQGQSLMPEGLEEALTMQAMADLLEYISSAQAEK